MIFVTVGTQLPFDRMVRAVDEWAAHQPPGRVFAQIGPADWHPCYIEWAQFLPADECRRRIESAEVVVAHAGMGSIITSLELGKPILVMPRLAGLGEHRNDHQVSTARRLLAQGRIAVAFDEAELAEKLDRLETLHSAERISVQASPRLIEALRHFVNVGALPGVPRDGSDTPPEYAIDRPLSIPVPGPRSRLPVSRV